ncbi:11299_t:CDS:2, partial [Entrophospora sp. SA101]
VGIGPGPIHVWTYVQLDQVQLDIDQMDHRRKSNHYALCHFCKTKLTNTKKLVTSHLKYCTIFKEQYTEHEQEKILFPGNENNQYNGSPELDSSSSIS